MAVPNFATASRPLTPSSADPASTPNLASSASTTSLKENVLSQLTALKDVAHSIFNAINDVANDKISSTKITTSKHPLALVKKAVQIDAALQRAVDQIDAHQKYQSQISAVQLLIAEEDAAILNIIQQLQVAKAELENVIYKAKKEPTIRDLTNREPLEFDTIIKVAKNLAKYTSAPPTFNPAVNDSLIVVEPPYPSELAMRAGLINQPNLGLTTSSLSQEDAPNVTKADAQHANIQRPPTMQYQEDDETTHPLFDLDLNPDLE